MSDSDRLARLALSKVFEPGSVRVGNLVAELGAELVLASLLAEQDVADLLTDAASRLPLADDTARDLDRATRAGLRWVVPGDPEWPGPVDDLATAEPLGGMGAPPLGLWVKGPLRLDELRTPVALVGSRSSTTYGDDAAGELACHVARAGSAVISGAAFGIDQAAHRGALAGGGPTVAVLACGADRVYPAAHHELIATIARTGAVVSEVPPGWAPMRHRFLARNRVIAAIARGTVVVEAASRSGALNTATWTSRLQRPLMGVPGAMTSATSEGVHALIRDGAATLVTRGEHVLEVVGAAGEHLVEEPRGADRPRDRLDDREQRVLEAVPVASAAPSDSIARAAGIGVVEVRARLETLARRGMVERLPVGWRLAGGAVT